MPTNETEDGLLRRHLNLAANSLIDRSSLMQSLLGGPRDIDRDCGYPKGVVPPTVYQGLYDREPVAARVVEVYPKECWQVQPSVYEDEDSETETAFEAAWAGLATSIRAEKSYHQDEQGSVLWEYLYRADVLSGVGHYGIILLGIDDGKDLAQPADLVAGSVSDEVTLAPEGTPWTPLPGTPEAGPIGETGPRLGGRGTGAGGPAADLNRGARTKGFAGGKNRTWSWNQADEGNGKGKKGPKRKLTFLRVFPESMAWIDQFDSNPASPRFGQPVRYTLIFNDPAAQAAGVGLQMITAPVHWTRVIHVADNLASSEVFGVPRQQPVLNRLLDIRKIHGGSAEMYWRGAFPGYALETLPQLGTEVDIDQEGVKKMMWDWANGLQRHVVLTGLTMKSLSPQVTDPSPQVNTQIEAICIKLGVPIRIFKGSERGELASSQDDAAWNDRLKQRQAGYVTPRLIVPFVDRLIALGVLPAPEGYSVWWPDLTSKSDQEKAAIASQRTTGLVAYGASAPTQDIITPTDYLIKVQGFDEAEAQSVVENAQAEKDKREKEQAKQQADQLKQQQDQADAEHQRQLELAAAKGPQEPPPGGGGSGNGSADGVPPTGPGGSPGGSSGTADAGVQNYDPDQPRDDTGKWASSGAGGNSATLADGRTLHFVPHPAQSQWETMVMVDPRKLDAAIPAYDRIDEHGHGQVAIPGRREQVTEFLKTGQPVQASRGLINQDGTFGISDGRHRFSTLRDLGASAVGMTVPKEDAKEMIRRFGRDADQALLAKEEAASRLPEPAVQKEPPPGFWRRLLGGKAATHNYHPHQPRVPAGTPGAGQFARDHGDTGKGTDGGKGGDTTGPRLEDSRDLAYSHIKESGPTTASELGHHFVEEGHSPDHGSAISLVHDLHAAGHLERSVDELGLETYDMARPATDQTTPEGDREPLRNAAKVELTGGHWITVEGRHVYVKDDTDMGVSKFAKVPKTAKEAGQLMADALAHVKPEVAHDAELHAKVAKNWTRELRGKVISSGKDYEALQRGVKENLTNKDFRAVVAVHGPQAVVLLSGEGEKHRAQSVGATALVYSHTIEPLEGSNGQPPKPGMATSEEGGGVGAVLRHEYAHRVYGQLPTTTKERWESKVSELYPDPADVKKELTVYAGKHAGKSTSKDEVFTEAFALGTSPHYDPSLFSDRARGVIAATLVASKEREPVGNTESSPTRQDVLNVDSRHNNVWDDVEAPNEGGPGTLFPPGGPPVNVIFDLDLGPVLNVLEGEQHLGPDWLEELLANAATGPSPWGPYLGPRGGRGWKNINTGRIVYGSRQPGLGRGHAPVPTALGTPPAPAATPVAGTAPGQPKAQRADPATVKAHIAKLLANPSKITPDHIREVKEQLLSMTVAQIHGVRKDLGLKASGVKADLAAKVSQRALAGLGKAQPQTQTPAPTPPQHQPPTPAQHPTPAATPAQHQPPKLDVKDPMAVRAAVHAFISGKNWSGGAAGVLSAFSHGGDRGLQTIGAHLASLTGVPHHVGFDLAHTAVKELVAGLPTHPPKAPTPPPATTPTQPPGAAPPSPLHRGANVITGTPAKATLPVVPHKDEIEWSTGKPQPGTLHGVDFAPAPPKFWEKVRDKDVGEPPPTRPIARAGVMVQEPDGRIWIAKPTNEYGDRKYTMPGGGVEHGLTHQQNALKEVWEETGLQVEITGHLGDFRDSNNGNIGRLYIGKRIGGAPWDAKVEPHIIDQKTGKPGAESSEVVLVTPERARNLLHRSDDLAQLMTVAPIPLRTPTRGRGSAPMEKFVEAIQPAANAYKADKHAKGETPGNAELHAIQDIRGFNAKPAVVGKKDMDALVAKGDHIEVLRGVTADASGGTSAKQAADKLADEFRYGDHYPGYGIFGSGTYTDSTKGYGNIATQYASGYRGAGGSGGAMMRMAIPKDARIVKYSELQRTVPAAPPTFTDKGKTSTSDQDWRGMHAALAGYDAIHMDEHGYGHNFYVILNRGVVTVQKEDASGHVIK